MQSISPFLKSYLNKQLKYVDTRQASTGCSVESNTCVQIYVSKEP